MIYGVCLVCLTPREPRKTVTDWGTHVHIHWEIIYPCGHTKADVDAKLDEML